MRSRLQVFISHLYKVALRMTIYRDDKLRLSKIPSFASGYGALQ